jgi:hypothetical protein
MITIRDQYMLDLLIIGSQLPQEEIIQYEAFTGEKYDHQVMAARAFQLPGPRWTFAAPSFPLVTGGCARLHKGTYRSWFLAQPAAWSKEWCGDVTKATADIVKGMMDQPHVNRLETICLASREKARLWYSKVGLEYESTLRGYGCNGEDAVTYVGVKKPPASKVN